MNQNFKDFEEGEDFTGVTGGTPVQGGNGNVQYLDDYALTLDMAKQLCMMSHTELGKQYRKYFIELERKWNDPQEVVKRGYAILQNENMQLKIENETMKPKVEYHDNVLANEGLEPISAIAKNYGYSAVAFNKLLHKLGVQYKRGRTWYLYERYQDKGYTHIEPHAFTDCYGEDRVSNTMKWTQKGQKFLYDLLKEHGIKLQVEQTTE